MGQDPIRYAELHCHTNFSFLDGASHPHELVAVAAELGYTALAVTDHDGFYGAVKVMEAARDIGMPVVYGVEVGIEQESGGDIADPVAQAEAWDAERLVRSEDTGERIRRGRTTRSHGTKPDRQQGCRPSGVAGRVAERVRSHFGIRDEKPVRRREGPGGLSMERSCRFGPTP